MVYVVHGMGGHHEQYVVVWVNTAFYYGMYIGLYLTYIRAADELVKSVSGFWIHHQHRSEVLTLVNLGNEQKIFS